MVTLILVILLSVFASIESAAYGVYEIKINKNKAGGIILILLSIIGLIFPTIALFNS